MGKCHKAKTQMTDDANQVWTWDISHLPGIVKEHYYLYIILDIFTRKIVRVEIFDK